MKNLYLIIVLFLISNTIYSQKWQDENRGLYPNSLQITINAPNEMIGIIYGYSFKNPVFKMPFGIYGEFSNKEMHLLLGR